MNKALINETHLIDYYSKYIYTFKNDESKSWDSFVCTLLRMWTIIKLKCRVGDYGAKLIPLDRPRDI